MIRFVADEDFNGRTLAILRNLSALFEVEIHVSRVQDVGLMSASDSAILDWAAANRRILLTHDQRSMASHADMRIRRKLPTPGVFMVRQHRAPNEQAYAILDEVTLRIHEGREWDNEVVWL